MLQPTPVSVVNTGVANLASVVVSLRRAGGEPVLIDSACEIEQAERLVLPGVGAFGAAMQRLRELNIVEAIQQRINVGRPTLAICLGLQLFATASEENSSVAGLGIIPNKVIKLESIRVPQLGWNYVASDPASRFLSNGHAYFANSYCLDRCPEGWIASWSENRVRFIGAIERGPVLACQFHPELSGQWGRKILQRWLSQPTVPEPAQC